MQHAVVDPMHRSPIPFLDRIPLKQIEVLVIAVNEQSRKRLGPMQPLQPILIFLVSGPDQSEVPDNDHVVIFRQFLLFGKIFAVQTLVHVDRTVDVSRHIDQKKRSFRGWRLIGADRADASSMLSNLL